MTDRWLSHPELSTVEEMRKFLNRIETLNKNSVKFENNIHKLTNEINEKTTEKNGYEEEDKKLRENE